MKKFLKYSIRILLGLIVLIVVLVVLAGLLIQTSPVKRKIAQIAENQAEKVLNGQLSIGEIDGNFFTNLELKHLLLADGDDTLAYIPSFRAQYNLWPLLKGKLNVQLAEIDHPRFFLEQQQDSVWNFQQLVKTANEEPQDTTTTSSFEFNLSTFNLINGRVFIEALDTVIPQQIDSLNLLCSGYYSPQSQKLQLSNLSFNSLNPNLNLKKLAFNFNRNADKMVLNDLHLKTALNQLDAAAEYEAKPQTKAASELESAPLQLKEFEFFLSGFKLPATPVLTLDADLQNDSVFATVDLIDKDQQIHLEVSSDNLMSFLTTANDSVLNYQLNGKLKQIDLSYWLGNPELKYVASGDLQIDGKGTDPKAADLSLQADFRDCIIQDRPVEKLFVSAHLNNGNLEGEVEGKGDFGYFRVVPEIQNWQTEPRYELDLFAEKLNLANLIGNDSLQSNLNFQGHVKGKNFDPKQIAAAADLAFSKSRLHEIELDTLIASIDYQNENITIDSLWMQTQSATVEAAGNYSFKSNSDINLTAEFDNIDEFSDFIPLENLKSSGKVIAQAKGTVDRLMLNADVQLGKTSFQSFQMEKVKLTADGELNKQDTVFNGRLTIENFRNNNLVLDSLSANVNYTADSIDFETNLGGGDLISSLQGDLKLGNPLRIRLNDWLVEYKKQQWTLQEAPAIIEIDSLNYRIDHFKLASGNADSLQYILANGTVSRVGEENFELEIANIDIEDLLKLLDQQQEAEGILNVNMSLSGNAASPVLDGKISVDQSMFNGYEFLELGGTFGYHNDQMDVQLRLVPLDSGRIELNGIIPLKLQMDSLSFNVDPKDSIDAKLTIEQFPLAVIREINIAEEIAGSLNGEVNVKGTMESPDPKGNLALDGAEIRIPEYGIDYKDIQFNMEFLPNQVRLDTFYVKSDDGDLTANGTIDFNSDFYKGDVSQSKINLKFDEFNPVNHRQFNMQLSGDASLSGKKGDVVFDGDLTIPQAEVYLPAIMNMVGKVSVPDIPKPILVQELEKQQEKSDSLNLNVDTKETSDSINFDYLDVLTGRVRLNIPKNTWIKNEDLRIEISGDLEMIKNKEFFELFGSVEVVRGQYDLLGRTFMIDKGTIGFHGGEELMPEMDITASYSFRNSQRAEQKLSVHITGTAESPSVNFTLDGSNISEGDALSYIMFGKGMNELTINEQENVSGAGSLAETAAASFLSAQISSFLSEKLNVDYIEVKSDGGFGNATVVVGKYITNDLFVSYEQRFGEIDEKDISKYEVRLEYELFKFLFFQLNNSSVDSGFDVIFKLDAE